MKINKTKIINHLKVLGLVSLGVVIGVGYTLAYQKGVEMYQFVQEYYPTDEAIRKQKVTLNGGLPSTVVASNEKAPKSNEGETAASPSPSSKVAVLTTYNAEVGQTDADPYTMASGKKVYEGAVASNCHKIGTKIEVEGLGTFTVEDRMNSRFTGLCGTKEERLDVFKWNRADNFKQIARYSVVENNS